MKKKISIFAVLVLMLLIITGCDGKIKLVKNDYTYGISNFYQEVLTGFENGLQIQKDRINLGEDKTKNENDISVLEGVANETFGLLESKEYIFATIDTFTSENNNSKIYFFTSKGNDTDFVVTKVRDVSLSFNSKSYAEYKITQTTGHLILGYTYVRLDSGKYEVAVPLNEEKTDFQVWTVEYDNGYASLQTKVNNVIYKTEVLFDKQGVMYIVLTINNEFHYELSLGSSSVHTSCSLNIKNSEKEVSFIPLSAVEWTDNFGRNSEYSNTLTYYHYYDGKTFENNSSSFKGSVEDNQSIQAKYIAYMTVVEDLKG